MVNWIFLAFAVSAGVAAFFSPCSVALLPGYVTYYLSKKTQSSSVVRSLLSSILFALQAILGFFLLFGLAGTLLLVVGQQVKSFIPGFAILTGLFLIFLGLNLVRGKDMFSFLSQYLHFQRQDPSGILFGIMYGIGALGCTFPLFVSVVLGGITDSLVGGLLSILSYILGMSMLMLLVTIATGLAREFVQRNIERAIPYVSKFSGIVITAAGGYMIYYQLVFL